MPVSNEGFRKVASILYGKLEMDVTKAELAVAKKAYALFQKGTTVAEIRRIHSIPSVVLSERARARTATDAARAQAANYHSLDNAKARLKQVASSLNM